MFYNKQNSDVLTSRFGLKHSSNNVVNDNMSFKSMYVFVKSVKIIFPDPDTDALFFTLHR